MTDVLERLRAENPVPEGSPPPFDQVWQSVLARPPRRRAVRTRSAAWAALALIPVAIVILVASTTLGHKSPTASSGGAAAEFVVHYKVRNVFQLGLRGRSGPVYMAAVDDVWVSGRSAHWYQSQQLQGRRRSGEVVPVEFATDGRVLASFSLPTSRNPSGKLLEVRAGDRPRCSLLVLFCPFAPRDPAAAVRMALARGLLVRGARRLLLAGRRVDELRRNGSPSLEIFVMHGTLIPVEVIAHSIGPLRDTEVETISDYERLPLTPANRGLLRMSSHPGATLCTVLPGAGGITRLSGPDSCFVTGAGTSDGSSHHPAHARPLPAAVLRSFRLLAGVAVGEAKAIPNGLGWRIWIVPWKDHVCLTVANPSNGPSAVSRER